MISLKNMSASHIVWIVFAVIIGMSISYVIIQGVEVVYGSIYDKTFGIITQNNNTPSTIQPTNINYIEETTTTVKATQDREKIEISVNIGFVGDIIPGINTPPDIFSQVILYTQKPDIMIGNLEGVITQHEYFKCKPDSKSCFAFNGDRSLLNLLSLASFDVLNIANNHFNDHGEEGQRETLAEIKRSGITASGIKNEITYINKNGLWVGIVGFSTYEWTNNLNNKASVEKIISEAKQVADIVVVVFHGGGEGEKYSKTPIDTEFYLGENRGNLRSFAYNAIDSGADIVLGSGPHVLRGIEKYKDRIIAYSLGNFASVNASSHNGLLKMSAMLDVKLNKDGTLIYGIVHPFQINSKKAPYPDTDGGSIKILNELSREDFGKDAVMLNSLGEIVF